MEKALEKTKASEPVEFRHEFWEVWVLALLLVTILGLIAQSRQSDLFSQTNPLQSQMDPYDIRPEENHRADRPLESGF